MKPSNHIILWNVYDYDGDETLTKATFKNPYKAADYCLKTRSGGVEMVLAKKEWNVKTMD